MGPAGLQIIHCAWNSTFNRRKCSSSKWPIIRVKMIIFIKVSQIVKWVSHRALKGTVSAHNKHSNQRNKQTLISAREVQWFSKKARRELQERPAPKMPQRTQLPHQSEERDPEQRSNQRLTVSTSIAFWSRCIPRQEFLSARWASWTRLSTICSRRSQARHPSSCATTRSRLCRLVRSRPPSACCSLVSSLSTPSLKALRPSQSTPATETDWLVKFIDTIWHLIQLLKILISKLLS